MAPLLVAGTWICLAVALVLIARLWACTGVGDPDVWLAALLVMSVVTTLAHALTFERWLKKRRRARGADASGQGCDLTDGTRIVTTSRGETLIGRGDDFGADWPRPVALAGNTSTELRMLTGPRAWRRLVGATMLALASGAPFALLLSSSVESLHTSTMARLLVVGFYLFALAFHSLGYGSLAIGRKGFRARGRSVRWDEVRQVSSQGSTLTIASAKTTVRVRLLDAGTARPTADVAREILQRGPMGLSGVRAANLGGFAGAPATGTTLSRTARIASPAWALGLLLTLPIAIPVLVCPLLVAEVLARSGLPVTEVLLLLALSGPLGLAASLLAIVLGVLSSSATERRLLVEGVVGPASRPKTGAALVDGTTFSAVSGRVTSTMVWGSAPDGAEPELRDTIAFLAGPGRTLQVLGPLGKAGWVSAMLLGIVVFFLPAALGWFGAIPRDYDGITRACAAVFVIVLTTSVLLRASTFAGYRRLTVAPDGIAHRGRRIAWNDISSVRADGAQLIVSTRDGRTLEALLLSLGGDRETADMVREVIERARRARSSAAPRMPCDPKNP